MARPEVVAATLDDPIGLLHADEEHLRLAAITLRRGGRFVLVVADSRLWPAASQLLCELLPEHRFAEHAPTSSDEANQAISDPLRDTPGLTIVIRITGRDAGPLETLNLRRESLVKAPANFLVVLDGDEAHSRFLREAPDCYSYRDLLVVVQGEPTLGAHELIDMVPDKVVDTAVEAAQQEADPTQRAQQLFYLALLLQRSQGVARARPLLGQAIIALEPKRQSLTDQDRLVLAHLYSASAVGCSCAERHRRIRKALEILAPVADQFGEQFAMIEGSLTDAIGIDLTAALDAVQRARASGGSTAGPLVGVAHAYWSRDDLVHARAVLDEISADDPVITTIPVLEQALSFRILVESGAWDEASLILSSGIGHALTFATFRGQMAERWATLLMRQGEGRAAARILDRVPPDVGNELTLVRIIADGGQLSHAASKIEEILCRPWESLPSGFDDAFAAHQLLVYLTAQGIAAGTPVRSTDSLDACLAALRDRVEHHEDLDPPWDAIHCRLLQADAYLKRYGAEQAALSSAEQALALAEVAAEIQVPGAIRRGVVALLRLGELAHGKAWLTRGLASARKHGLLGDEAQLHGLALWHAALAGENTTVAEADMQAAFAASGSKLVEASVLARTGAALDRRDLLRRAQQIYRSLPWPAREGACLEALGETQIAEARYRTYGLAMLSAILARRPGPPPITAVDDH
jgi:hypothetical protein